MDNCIFCKIISGEIPSSKVYEDDKVLAFLDISQATKGHTLVIPKEHVRNILEMSAETAETVFSRVPKIARAVQKATREMCIRDSLSRGQPCPLDLYQRSLMTMTTFLAYQDHP